ncbi:MAG: hypothetical protein ABSB35_19155 [Bryobacteraceae bacterium]
MSSRTVYGRFFEHVFLPIHGLLRKRSYLDHRRFLEKSQWWSPEEIRSYQWTELQKLFAHAFHSVPYYRRKYAAVGFELNDLKTWKDFARLPILTREEVNAHREELCSNAFRGKLMPHATGGSSGVPVRFFRTLESYDWRTACSDRAYEWSGWRLGERSVYLWGAAVGRVPRTAALKKKTYEHIRRQLIFNTFSHNAQVWNTVYESIRRFKPVLVVGYVSSLLEFSRFLSSSAKTLSGLKGVITAAEPLSEKTRAYIADALGAPVFNTYGSREFMSIAGECSEHRGLHVHSENLLVETDLPPEQGASRILVTDLHNYGMPFIKYAMGDLGVLGEAPCTCGRGLPLLSSIDGRELDRVKTASGRFISCLYFVHLMKDLPEVLEFQVQQRSIEEISVSVVLAEGISAKSQALFDGEMKKVLGDQVNVKLVPVEHIARSQSGKHKVIIGIE